jgi:uncharacterized protein
MRRNHQSAEDAKDACNYKAMKTIAIYVIRLYRAIISPYVPTECRYYPTCSRYMAEAIEKKGIWKGILLGLRRILKCNPLFPGGYDPVK